MTERYFVTAYEHFHENIPYLEKLLDAYKETIIDSFKNQFMYEIGSMTEEDYRKSTEDTIKVLDGISSELNVMAKKYNICMLET